MRKFYITVKKRHSHIVEDDQISISWHAKAGGPKQAFDQAIAGGRDLFGLEYDKGTGFLIAIEEIVSRSWLQRVFGIGIGG